MTITNIDFPMEMLYYFKGKNNILKDATRTITFTDPSSQDYEGGGEYDENTTTYLQISHSSKYEADRTTTIEYTFKKQYCNDIFIYFAYQKYQYSYIYLYVDIYDYTYNTIYAYEDTSTAWVTWDKNIYVMHFPKRKISKLRIRFRDQTIYVSDSWAYLKIYEIKLSRV